MEYENLYTYLGYGVIILLLILIINTITHKTKKESFMGIFEDTTEDKGKDKGKDITEEDNTTKQLNTYLKTIQDGTNTAIKQMKLEQNRDIWEKLIVAMEDNIDIVSLRSIAVLAEKMKKNPTDSNLAKVIERLNTFSEYKKTLKENMKYLDGLQ